MWRRPLSTFILFCFLPMLLASAAWAQAPREAEEAFRALQQNIEAKLSAQRSSGSTFLTAALAAKVRSGEIVAEPLPAGRTMPEGAMLSHWRAAAFVPGETVAGFAARLRDVADYPHRFAPEVLRASIVAVGADRFLVNLRVRQKHVLPVVLDTSYDVRFGQPDERHGFSDSRSTRIAEIAQPGTPQEHALSPAEEHGFLWQQNTYWTYEARDGGLYVQMETISLTRSVPRGLGWLVAPYLQSIPRESIEFTLNALRRAPGGTAAENASRKGTQHARSAYAAR